MGVPVVRRSTGCPHCPAYGYEEWEECPAARYLQVQVQVSTGTVSTSRYYERGDNQFVLCKDLQFPFYVWISSKGSLSGIFITAWKVCPDTL